MILRGDKLVVEMLGKEPPPPTPEGNKEAGRYGGAGQVNKYVKISDRA